MLPEHIQKRMSALDKAAAFIRGKAEATQKQVRDLEESITLLDIQVLKWDKVGKILAALVDGMVKEDLQKIDNLVTHGLKVVFPDRNITFHSSMVMVGDKLQVDFKTLDDGKAVAKDAYGSVSVIESLILRILCILKTGTGKLLLLDETFSALDGDYVQRVGVLLKELSAETGIDILLVTFNGVVSDADTVLRARLNHKTRELSITGSKGGSDAKTL